MKSGIGTVGFGRVFDIEKEQMPRGAWWWWFWLFFFDNPENPAKPRQLMILWSTKNTRKIKCNDLDIRLKPPLDRRVLDGAVAAWYFDGERMHHNFLLEQCSLKISERVLCTDSATPTSFAADNDGGTVVIGDRFRFVANLDSEMIRPYYRTNNIIGSRGYSILRANRLVLSGQADGEEINGTAYFQRVFINTPATPWYWGVFHFGKGGVLTYFNPRAFGKSIKKHIGLFDGLKNHEFWNIKVRKIKGPLPRFLVSGESEAERIKFLVKPYAHSSWSFKKRYVGVIPNKLVYNEYPSTISRLELLDKKDNSKMTLDDLGASVGNAEHTTGYLF